MKKYKFILIVVDPEKGREENFVFRFEGLLTIGKFKGLLNTLKNLNAIDEQNKKIKEVLKRG